MAMVVGMSRSNPMTTSPISLPVLFITLLALALAYGAGAYASGIGAALCLIGSGILAVVAVFMEASEAYAQGREDLDGNGD